MIHDRDGRTIDIVIAPAWDQIPSMPRIGGRRWHFLTLSGDPLVPPFCVHQDHETDAYVGLAGDERTEESLDREVVLREVGTKLFNLGVSIVRPHDPRRLYIALTVATQHLLGLLPLVERLDEDGEPTEALRSAIAKARTALKECC